MKISQNKDVYLAAIYKLSAQFFKLKYSHLIGQKTGVNYNYPRQIISYYIFKYTNISITELAEFQNKSENSVRYQVKKIEKISKDRIKKQRINHYINYMKNM